MKMFAASFAIAALLCVAPANARGDGRPPAEEIVFRVRTISVVCTGMCPYFGLAVRRDGQVEERWYGIVNESDGEVIVKRWSFRVSRSAAAAFFTTFAPFRPAGQRQFGAPCDTKFRDDPGVRHGLSEYEIRWQGGGAPGNLEACFDDVPVRRAVDRALLLLRLDAYGRRMGAADARRRYARCSRDLDALHC